MGKKHKKAKKASKKKEKKHKKEKALKQTSSASLTRFDGSKLAGSESQLGLVKCIQCKGKGQVGLAGLKRTCPTCGGTGRAAKSANKKYQTKLHAAHQMNQNRIRKQQQQNQQRMRQQQLQRQRRRR